MRKYDAVVIGAGNGGLTAAIRLLQGGARVLLVEKHNIPGGFATSFRRGRFEFEASLHELNDFGTADNAGDVRVLFDELGVTDKIEWVQIPEAYRVISQAEKLDATMPFGVKAFIDKMRAGLLDAQCVGDDVDVTGCHFYHPIVSRPKSGLPKSMFQLMLKFCQLVGIVQTTLPLSLIPKWNHLHVCATMHGRLASTHVRIASSQTVPCAYS